MVTGGVEHLSPEDATIWCVQSPDALLQLGGMAVFDGAALRDQICAVPIERIPAGRFPRDFAWVRLPLTDLERVKRLEGVKLNASRTWSRASAPRTPRPPGARSRSRRVWAPRS